MVWLQFPFLRFLIFLIVGLWLGANFPFHGSYKVLLIVLVVGYLFCLVLSLASKRFLWLLLPILGYGLYNAHINEFRRPFANTGMLVIHTKQHTSSKQWVRYEASVKAQRQNGKWYSANREIILYVRDSSAYLPGQRLLFKGELSMPKQPVNEFVFDYANFLKHQNIHGQLFLTTTDIFQLDSESSFWLYRYRIQARIRHMINEWFPDQNHAAILTGMVLGEKRGLGTDISRAFSVTGSMHILAVSGLHVGLIYGMLTFLFSWMPKYTPWPWIRWLLFLCLLLTYAGLANFSPSVIRAVVFVLLFLLARLINRPNPLNHVLFLTAFIMLLFSPFQLFQVSFQLSFMAVLGILLFMPMLSAWFSHRYTLLDYFLKNIAMSLAVQLTTMGLSIFYFHQVSFVFWISAMLVVPVTFVVLILTLGLFISAGMPAVQEILLSVTSWLLEAMTTCLEWLADIPGSHLTGITFPLWLVLPVPILVYWTYFLMNRRRIRSFWWLVGAWMIYGIASVQHLRSFPGELKSMILSTREYWAVGVVSDSDGYYFIPENPRPDSSWIERNVLPWFIDNRVRGATGNILPTSEGVPVHIKIDSLTMVFSMKSDNLPLSHWQVILGWENKQDTMQIPTHKDAFNEIKLEP